MNPLKLLEGEIIQILKAVALRFKRNTGLQIWLACEENVICVMACLQFLNDIEAKCLLLCLNVLYLLH